MTDQVTIIITQTELQFGAKNKTTLTLLCPMTV